MHPASGGFWAIQVVDFFLGQLTELDLTRLARLCSGVKAAALVCWQFELRPGALRRAWDNHAPFFSSSLSMPMLKR
jgi:hypothetical protein